MFVSCCTNIWSVITRTYDCIIIIFCIQGEIERSCRFKFSDIFRYSVTP